MTPQERIQIVDALSEELNAKGPIALANVPRCLPDKSCPPNLGPKKWLETEFPEFYVFGTNGREMVDFADSPLVKFYQLLLSAVPALQAPTRVPVFRVRELIGKAGLDPSLYSSAESLGQLLRVYPAYELVEQLQDQPVSPAAAAAELNFVHAVSYMNWRMAYNKIHCHAVNSSLSQEAIRDSIARRFTKALVDGEGLLLDAMDDDPQRVVLFSGYHTDDGREIYCVLQPNVNKDKRQAWMLGGVVYPDEADEAGLGAWLARKFFPQSGITYQTLRAQIDELMALRAALLPQVSGLLQAVEDCACPAAISRELGEYERVWAELLENLAQFPSICIDGELRLPELLKLLEEKNEVLDLAKQAVSRFELVYDETLQNLSILKAVPPQGDLETVRGLFAHPQVTEDVQTFRDLLEPYICLKKILCARDMDDVLAEIGIAAKHFSLSKMKIAGMLLGEYSAEYAYLEQLGEIDRILESCLLSADAQVAHTPETVDADTMAAEILNLTSPAYAPWLHLYCALIPEAENLRYAILTPTDETSNFTPGSIAQRILAACGNRDRLAERYLLLGLITDRAACVPQLLKLYREQDDRERFLALWDSDYREADYSPEDACYRLALRCATETVAWEEIEEFVALNPGVKTLKAYRDTIIPHFFRPDEQSTAYHRWLGMSDLRLNELEAAVVDNDTDTVYQLLAEPQRLEELGYSDSELQTVRQAVSDGLAGGTDLCAKARRLYRVQKNKNCSAEYLLWSAPLTAASQQLLFAIYSDLGDHESVCWLIQKFSIPTDDPTPALRYAEALSATKQFTVLSELMMGHPELWHKSALLANLEEEPWPEIYQRETADPIRPLTRFSAALIADDAEAMARMLADTETMTAWGYSATMLEAMGEKLSTAPRGTDRVSVVKRFKHIQGNLNRDMEQYLYLQCHTNQNWAAQQLYALTFAEGRYLDALRYFECYPMLQRSDSNVCVYLWCLLRLERDQTLVEQALRYPNSLRLDRELVKAILDYVRQKNMAAFADDIQRMVTRLPVNAFEEIVMQSKHAQMQEYISDPDLLLSMGYSPEQIKHFKECISKPLPYGSEGYPLGVRMRMFFGNERALPFLEDAAADPRSAKMLLDIYFSHARWDDVCSLYRAHLEDGTWNSTFEMRYLKALSQSRIPENCQAYLEYLQSEGYESQNDPLYSWKYLRCLFGTRQEEAAMAEMDHIMDADCDCTSELVPDVLDLGWENGSDGLRRHLVLFAARICLKNMAPLTPAQQKNILSINGRLLQDEASQGWIELLNRNGLEKASVLLMCYFNYGIDSDSQSLQAAGDTLFKLLEASDESDVSDILTAVTAFSMSNGLLDGDTREKQDALVAGWLKVILRRSPDTGLLGLETLSTAEFSAFYGFWKIAAPAEEQLRQVFDACFAGGEARSEWTPQFFQRTVTLMEKLSGSEEYETVYSAALMSAFTDWFSTLDETQADAIRAAAVFLRDAAFSAAQLQDFLEHSKDRSAVYDQRIWDAILSRCENNWPDVMFRYLQNQYYCPEQEARQHEALNRAQLLVYTEQIEFGTDNQSLQFVYSIICNNPNEIGLNLLYKLYSKAGKTDQADILRNLAALCREDADTAALCEWFHGLLDTQTVEWIEYHSKWWAPLVLLRESDNQTKSILSYLIADETSKQYKQSVLRLLLSDLVNGIYIGCYLRLAPEMPASARGKLSYIRAVHTPAVCESAIQDCIAMKQHLFAVKLLTTRINAEPAKAVFIGQTLGEIYTAESMGLYPELKEYVPVVFRFVISLNRADPKGAWKNIGRAVDIAILTAQENLFLDIFNREYQNVYLNYAGKCAALIANMILRGEYGMARHYLDEYSAASHNDPFSYMALIRFVIGQCEQTGHLTPENEILLRSIPTSGNMRPLELYGALACQAMEQNRLDVCARAFYRLRAFTAQDKALVAGCVHLYGSIAGELSVEELYDVTREYLYVAQDSQTARLAQCIAVIAACIPEKVDYRQLVNDCNSRTIEGHQEVMRKVHDLWQKCTRFLNEDQRDPSRRMFLLRAATGWWHIDRDSIRYFAKYPELCSLLADLYTTPLYSACITAVLRCPEDPLLLSTVVSLFSQRNYDWGKEQVKAAARYPEEHRMRIAQLLDSPTDLPGLYSEYLAHTIAEADEELFVRQMTMLLVIQQNYQSKQYEENICRLKDMSEACPSARKLQISRLILEKTVSNGTIEKPGVYLNAKNYEMTIIAAKKLLEHSASDFFTSLHNAYLDLGRFMTEKSTTRTYRLQQLMNMATVLCQSSCYEDLDKLLEVCPAKWKLCLRAVQELIQGDPRNVLLLLNNPDFRSHTGCYSFVSSLAKGCLRNKRWLSFAQREGLMLPDLNSFPSVKDVPLIWPNGRNPANIGSFAAFVDTYVPQMNEEDRQSKRSSNDTRRTADTPKAAAVPENAETSAEEITVAGVAGAAAGSENGIWKIPFVAESLEMHREDDQPKNTGKDPGEAEENPESPDREERKDALRKALRERPGDTEPHIALLAELRQEPVTYETRSTCVKLGMLLYREACTHNGMATYATERSREILYSLAPLCDTLAAMPGMAANIKVCVQECLVSYRSLSALTGDCASDALLQLCDIIAREDADAAEYLKKHILFAREIGQKMREPMTNTERQQWLHRCIMTCRTVESPVEKGAKETLANILDQEIRTFRNKAQLDLHVYNTECAAGYGCIFGKVDNIGGEGVNNLVLSLYVDDQFTEQYSLASLASQETVPFALPCGDETTQQLSYKLMLKYTTQDGTEEQAQPLEGRLTFREQESNNLRKYDASNPADQGNYVERASITATLESNYLVEGGFRRFPNMAIYGMKRSGKSSVLRRLGRLFDSHYPDDVCHVIVSCEGLTGDFYTRVHYVFVKYVLDELNFKFNLESMDGWQEFSEKWEEPPEGISDFRWLDRFYTTLTRQWLPGKGLVILIDEIERLYYEFEENTADQEGDESLQPESVDSSTAQAVLWDVLNKMTQRDGSAIRFVLCGSDFFTSKIIAEGDNLTQFFQKGVKLNVERMEYGEIREALRANSSVILPDDTLDYLWNIANGLPWHSKVFCNSVIDHELRQEARTRITIYPSDIQDSIDRILSSTKDIASPVNFGLLSLNSEEDLLVRVAAQALDSRLAAIHVDDLLELACQAGGDSSKTPLYAKSLRSLVSERKLLRQDKRQNYQFSCELYRMYLRKELPPRFMK